MVKKVKNIGINRVVGTSTSVGIGYIYLPQDVDRDIYVQSCYNTGTVSLINDNSQFFHKVPIGKIAIQFIEFPKDYTELGTPVSYIYHPTKNKPIIVDVYTFDTEITDIQEHQYAFTKKFGENIVEISADGKNGTINLSIDAQESEEQGQINIKVSNINKTGQLNVEVFGDAEIIATSKVKLKSYTDTDILAVENMNLKTSQILDIFAKKIAKIRPIDQLILGAEDQSLVLGDILQEFLDKFIDQVSNITTSTMIGTQPIINKVQVTNLKKETSDVLSKYGFIKNNKTEIEEETI